MKRMLILIVAILVVLAISILPGCKEPQVVIETVTETVMETVTETVEVAKEEEPEDTSQIDPWIVQARQGLDEIRVPIAEGYFGPNDEPVSSDADLFLTIAEAQQIQQGKEDGSPYKLAVAWHSLAGMTEYGAAWQKGIYDVCDYLGIEIVGETDGEYNPEKQKSDVETLIALNPDAIISAPIDLQTASEVFKPAVDAGIKLSLVSNIPEGFVHGVDFVGCSSYDPWAVGVYQAEAVADVFGEEAGIGFIYWEGLYWPANFQEKIMRENLATLYPDIELVEDQGFLDVADAGDIGAAMILRNPDLDGFFVSWMDPGQFVLTAIKESGNYYPMVSNSINRIAMISMATDEILKTTVTDLPYHIGVNSALVAAYGLIEKSGPEFAVSPVLTVTKENIRKGWKLATDLPLPIEVEEVLVEQGL